MMEGDEVMIRKTLAGVAKNLHLCYGTGSKHETLHIDSYEGRELWIRL